MPPSTVEAAAQVVGDFIVDIKESDPEVYRAYTGGDAEIAWSNLERLLALVGPKHVTVRVPLIEHYNDEAATDRTAARLASMGVTHIDRFTYRTINNE